MKKTGKFKRIMALIAVVLLVVMYAMTIFFAIFDDARTMYFFKASIAVTIFIPIFIYGNQVVYRYLKNKNTSVINEGEDSK